MDDWTWVLVIGVGVLAVLVFTGVLGGSSNQTPSGSAYNPSGIGSAASAAITAIEEAAANSAKQLGSLAAKVESNVIGGIGHTFATSPVPNTSEKTYNQAVKSQLSPGILTGSGLAAQIAGILGGAVAGIPALGGAVVQGAASGEAAANALPAMKALRQSTGSTHTAFTNFMNTQDNAFTKWRVGQEKNLVNFVGSHLPFGL